MLKPPEMIRSFLRSNRVRKPSASKRPTSPVRMKRLPVGGEPFGLARLLGLAVVAGHHAAGVAHHLAGLAGGNFDAGLVDQAQVVAFGRAAHGVQLVGVVVRFQDEGAAAFGQAVELHQSAGPAFQHIGLQRGVEGGAGAELHAEAAQVVRVEVGPRHQALVLHRHQHGVGHALCLRQRQVAGGVEFGHQQHRAAKGQRGEEHHQRGVGVQRRGQQGHGVRPVAVGGAARDVGPAHAVRLHDALGRAGGAGRIDDVEGLAGLQGDRGGVGAGRGEPGLQRLAGRGTVQRDARHRAASGIAHGVGCRGIGEQHPRRPRRPACAPGCPVCCQGPVARPPRPHAARPGTRRRSRWSWRRRGRWHPRPAGRRAAGRRRPGPCARRAWRSRWRGWPIRSIRPERGAAARRGRARGSGRESRGKAGVKAGEGFMAARSVQGGGIIRKRALATGRPAGDFPSRIGTIPAWNGQR